MRRRDFLTVLAGVATTWPLAARAQQKAIPMVGVLMGGTPSIEAAKLGVFRDALKQLGYIEGQTILIEPRYAGGHTEQLPALARDISARGPALIVCVGGEEVAAVQSLKQRIPIVFMQLPNPVETGTVRALARPGGNITGFSQMTAELDPKRLELLREIAPMVSRAVFLVGPAQKQSVTERFASLEKAGKAVGIALRRLDIRTSAELAAALGTINASDGALLVPNDPVLTGSEGARIRDFALEHRLPAIYENKVQVIRGGLLSYGPDLNENYRGAARYVDKILRGATVGDLPVERPAKFELAINLKTAKAIGLAVPQPLLARADEVIE